MRDVAMKRITQSKWRREIVSHLQSVNEKSSTADVLYALAQAVGLVSQIEFGLDAQGALPSAEDVEGGYDEESRYEWLDEAGFNLYSAADSYRERDMDEVIENDIGGKPTEVEP